MAGVGTDARRAARLGPLPAFVTGGPHNPMGARGMYLYSGNKDTLYRIHGTNQPEYIGQAISSGCIRMTNEDAIDLYSRVKVGTIVVVLAPTERRHEARCIGEPTTRHIVRSEQLHDTKRSRRRAMSGAVFISSDA